MLGLQVDGWSESRGRMFKKEQNVVLVDHNGCFLQHDIFQSGL